MSGTDGEIIDAIRSAGWRQGTLIPPSCNILILDSSIDRAPSNATGLRLIIASHDCDLLNKSLKNEPYVELIAARPTFKQQPEIQNRKSLRKLQLSHQDSFLTICIHDRFRIPKSILIGIKIPRPEILIPDNLIVFQRWLADRYKRPAFPDEFNRRLGLKKDELATFYDKNSSISVIFINTTDEELPSEQKYDVKIILAYKNSLPANPIKTASELEEILEACLITADITAMLEDHITLSFLRSYKRLHLDYLSSGDEPSSPEPNEVN